MKNPSLICWLSLLAFTAGCEKTPLPPNGNDMPYPMQFVLLDKQGNELFTSEDTPIKVSSFNSQGQRFYVDSKTEYPDGKSKVIVSVTPSTSYPFRFIFNSLTMPLASSNGSKEWYLELNGKTDTLYYDVRHTRPNALYNQYDVVSVSFNGKTVTASGDPLNTPYYVLRRSR